MNAQSINEIDLIMLALLVKDGTLYEIRIVFFSLKGQSYLPQDICNILLQKLHMLQITHCQADKSMLQSAATSMSHQTFNDDGRFKNAN